MRQVQLAPESASAAIVPALLLSLVLAAGHAQPVAAGLVPFTGTETTHFKLLSQAFAITVTGSGVAVVNGSAGGNHVTQLSLAGGTFAANGLLVPVTDPAIAPTIPGVMATALNGPGYFFEPTTMMGLYLNGTMPILGVAKVCFFGSSCSTAAGNLSVPLAIGAPGSAVATGAYSFTVQGAPWTSGTASLGLTAMGMTSTVKGFAHGPASAASSTVGASGVLSLVTPFFISTNLLPNQRLAGYTRLTLHFVPEPGTLVLLGSGIAGLVIFGRSRRMRTRSV